MLWVSSKTTCSYLDLKAGLPRNGQPARRKASPLEQFPRAPLLGADTTGVVVPSFSCSLRLQLQLSRAFRPRQSSAAAAARVC